MLDYKGLSEEEVQKLIDFQIQMNQFDSLLERIRTNLTIQSIIYNSLRESQGIKTKS